MSDINKIVSKSRDVIIKFKPINEIINTHGAWFDGHGNLCVQYIGEKTSLAPSYFHYLGKEIKAKSHHSYPDWCIDAQYDDIFAINIALKTILRQTDLELIHAVARGAVFESGLTP